MPEVQETVTVIPGSALLWRIAPRPAQSAKVSSDTQTFSHWEKLGTITLQVGFQAPKSPSFVLIIESQPRLI